jgi:hypothetical protein
MGPCPKLRGRRLFHHGGAARCGVRAPFLSLASVCLESCFTAVGCSSLLPTQVASWHIAIFGCHRVSFSCAFRIPRLPRGEEKKKVTHTQTPTVCKNLWMEIAESRKMYCSNYCATTDSGTARYQYHIIHRNKISWVPHGQKARAGLLSLARSPSADAGQKCKKGRSTVR